jgi:predicted GNAT family N-acyltransferase
MYCFRKNKKAAKKHMQVYLLNVSDSLIEKVFAIRKKVFIDEQNVPQELERDKEDEIALHVLICIDSQAVATGRVFLDETMPEKARLGRVAVLKEFRGQGLGMAVVKKLISQAIAWNCKEVLIHSQLSVEKMYEKLGFIRRGEEFSEAGIDHVEMCLLVKSQND